MVLLVLEASGLKLSANGKQINIPIISDATMRINAAAKHLNDQETEVHFHHTETASPNCLIRLHI